MFFEIVDFVIEFFVNCILVFVDCFNDCVDINVVEYWVGCIEIG